MEGVNCIDRLKTHAGMNIDIPLTIAVTESGNPQFSDSEELLATVMSGINLALAAMTPGWMAVKLYVRPSVSPEQLARGLMTAA